MKTPKMSRTTRSRARSRNVAMAEKHILRLYVAGATERSRRAIERVRQLCERELGGVYLLEVIDIYQQPIIARDGQILATPTLVREFPRPIRRLIGDLSNTGKLFAGLHLDPKGRGGS